MLVLITYDVQSYTENGKKRLRKVAKKCEEYGVRVQNSVFECMVDSTQLKQLETALEEIIDSSVDSLRYYRLGKNHDTKIKHVGAKSAIKVDKPLIF
ncbi:CRISPR-associated protein, Cas2 family [Lentibacillus halodurans]|uniref:CRISPR-associated endoribonuclease Cas2 n=1 Tax=Lentibacillus halodurans TaxID=237679 RepID=A0A1I1AL05_9BACI|nr:CRISPR-associated endonuclease Cas2 [Lentibacillus halodurans]SFB38182.1 CRISPR-associated protein, Cas2 family [Lentibacillus halodurans]